MMYLVTVSENKLHLKTCLSVKEKILAKSNRGILAKENLAKLVLFETLPLTKNHT